MLHLAANMKEVLFILSGGGADGSAVSYGMCLHVSRVYHLSETMLIQAQLCYCFISQHPFLPLHCSVLREIVRVHVMEGGGFIPDRDEDNCPREEELRREKQAFIKITNVLNR